MFTVFANMRINSLERLQHMKESFMSFKDEPDGWLINIRGSYRDEARAFLKKELGDRARFFELLDDSRGWIANALEILPHAKHDIIFFWLEDHLYVAPPGELRRVAADMKDKKIQSITYSWWNMGWQAGRSKEQHALLNLQRHGSIEWSDIDAGAWQKVVSLGEAPYLISIAAMFEKDFFLALLRKDRKKLPFYFTPFLYRVMTLLQRSGMRFDQKTWFRHIDRLLFHTLRRFPKETPFDLEKAPDRFDMLPLRIAFPSVELFVCIDDDADPKTHGYSLVSRGEYPLTERLIVWDPTEKLADHYAKNMHMDEGRSFSERYCFYGIKNVRSTPVREHIFVLRGSVRISCGKDSLELEAGQGAAFYTNISHTITALTDTELVRYLPETGLAPHYFSA